jgi:hypothetical protein
VRGTTTAAATARGAGRWVTLLLALSVEKAISATVFCLVCEWRRKICGCTRRFVRLATDVFFAVLAGVTTFIDFWPQINRKDVQQLHTKQAAAAETRPICCCCSSTR